VSAALGRDLSGYRVAGLSAGNPAQRFGVSFSPAGASVLDRGVKLSVGLSGFGYESALRELGSAAPRVSANRVSYRFGSLTEWYANGPLGLEQGFALAARPAAGSGPLLLSLRISGGWAARMDGGSVLLSGRGVSLSYGGLVVTDARGRVLRSALRLVKRGVLIEVDDRGAAYPLRIDPFIQQARLYSSNGAAEDAFGVSVAVSGNTVVVGAPNHSVGTSTQQGEAYVFVEPASGWANTNQTTKLYASNGAAIDHFGAAVAVSGNTVVVGAYDHSVGKSANQGEAYVYVKPAAGWPASMTETGKLYSSNGAAGDVFGYAVAVSGNTVVVGAAAHSVGTSTQQGEAYLYVKPAAGWPASMTQTTKLYPSNSGKMEVFGGAVAVSGNTVVVGAPRHWVGTSPYQGEAYVYVKPAAGWPASTTQTAKLYSSNGAAGDYFGAAVAVSGNTVVVGAPHHALGTSNEQGEAYVYVEPAAGWPASVNQTTRLYASNGAGDDEFGGAVAVSGNTVVVGAYDHSVGTSTNQGEAYVYVKPAAGWPARPTETTKLYASNGGEGDQFGYAVAVSGNTAVVGAYGHTIGTHTGQGEAYLYVNSKLN